MEQTQQEFDSANFRINKLADQRNAAMDQIILLQEQLEQTRLENRKLHQRISELTPPLEFNGGAKAETIEGEVKEANVTEGQQEV